MPAGENRAVVRRVFEEVYNGHDFDLLDELVAEDNVNHSAVAEHRRGIEGFRHVIGWGMAMSPDARYEILGIIAEGNMVACRVRVGGTTQGEMFGVPATGKGFSAEHVHWHRVAAGKLAERWAVRDDLGP